MPVAEIDARTAPSRIGLPCLSLQPRAFASHVRGSVTRRRSVLPGYPVPIAAIHDGAPPGLVREIPVEGFSNAGLKGLRGTEAKVTLDLRCIDGIAAIVTRSILDEADQLFAGASPGGRSAWEA